MLLAIPSLILLDSLGNFTFSGSCHWRILHRNWLAAASLHRGKAILHPNVYRHFLHHTFSLSIFITCSTSSLLLAADLRGISLYINPHLSHHSWTFPFPTYVSILHLAMFSNHPSTSVLPSVFSWYKASNSYFSKASASPLTCNLSTFSHVQSLAEHLDTFYFMRASQLVWHHTTYQWYSIHNFKLPQYEVYS